jgi:cell division septation protein DedD
LAHRAEDDGFHEIQLNGKQLVFLFMAATVVSVVIFLCGVLVGRGVRADRAEVVAEAAGAAPVTTPSRNAVAAAPAGSDPTAVAAPPAVDELTYFNRLGTKEQPGEGPKATSGTPAATAPVSRPAEKPAPPLPEKSARAATPASPPVPAPAATNKPAAVESTSAVTAAGEPSGAGFALQVTALRERGEAEAIAKRLSSKGYAAYVMTPAAGAPSVYRVRVGKFKTRREAEAIATKLQKEEQFTPWITR